MVKTLKKLGWKLEFVDHRKYFWNGVGSGEVVKVMPVIAG